jgi:hypothetical protein
LSDLQWAAIHHHELNPFLGGVGHEARRIHRILLIHPSSPAMCEPGHTSTATCSSE